MGWSRAVTGLQSLVCLAWWETGKHNTRRFKITSAGLFDLGVIERFDRSIRSSQRLVN